MRDLSSLWLNWHKAKDTNRSPSSLIGLIEGSYEAFCYDQAVWYVAQTITSEVDKVGEKKVRGQASQEAAKLRKLNQLLGKQEARGQYADPAAMFASSND